MCADVLDKYFASPANTPDELDELLTALLKQHNDTDDGKWSRISEDFCLRAKDTKSRQWLKRRAKHLAPQGAIMSSVSATTPIFAESGWSSGDFGMVHSLESEQGRKMNGLPAEYCGIDKDSGRLLMRFKNDENNGNVKKLKQENVQRLTCSPDLRYREKVFIAGPAGSNDCYSLQEAWFHGQSCAFASIVLLPGHYYLGVPLMLEEETNLQLIAESRVEEEAPCVVLEASGTKVLNIGITNQASCCIRLHMNGIRAISQLRDCIDVWAGASLVLDNCCITSVREIAVGCQGNVNMHKCKVIGSSTGVLAAEYGNVILANVEICDCSKQGMELRGKGSTIVISDSEFKLCQEGAILMHGNAKSLEVSGTLFTSCGILGNSKFAKNLDDLRPLSAVCVGAGTARFQNCTFSTCIEAICVSGGVADLEESTFQSCRFGVTFKYGGSGQINKCAFTHIFRHCVYLYGMPGMVKITQSSICGHVCMEGDVCNLEVDDGVDIIHNPRIEDKKSGEAELKKVRKGCRAIGIGGVCDGCGRYEIPGEKKFQLCSGCKVTMYCSSKCQQSHWKSHKSFCKAHGTLPN